MLKGGIKNIKKEYIYIVIKKRFYRLDNFMNDWKIHGNLSVC